jgi:ketol-acid reductoisomerase
MVEEGIQKILPYYVCSKCPGSEVREEYKEVLGTTLILTSENDPNRNGFEQQAYASTFWRS